MTQQITVPENVQSLLKFLEMNLKEKNDLGIQIIFNRLFNLKYSLEQILAMARIVMPESVKIIRSDNAKSNKLVNKSSIRKEKRSSEPRLSKGSSSRDQKGKRGNPKASRRKESSKEQRI